MKRLIILLLITTIFSACSISRTDNLKQVSNFHVPKFENIEFEKQSENTVSNFAIPTVKPSNILEKLKKEKLQNPKISASDLAVLGSKLIKTEGYNFSFMTCDIAEANNITDEGFGNGDFRSFVYSFPTTGDAELKMEILNKTFGHPCGCDFDIPLLRAGKNQLTIFADGKLTNIKHLEKYYLEYTELVTLDLTKTLRRWYKPTEITPYGISNDGAKLFVETSYSNEDILNNLKDGLLLEISDDGTFKFVPKNDSNIITKYEFIEDFPKDPNNDYLGYLKFSDGTITHILKVVFPCT